MRYRLRHNLSYCMIDGRAIFLDIEQDRYFRLDGALADAFLAYVNSSDGHEQGRDALIRHGILLPESPIDDCGCDELAPPSRSLVEICDKSERASATAILEVLAIVWRMHRQLRTRALRHILDDLESDRETFQLDMALADPTGARMLDAARIFMHCRLYVPIETSCLLDSLALASYLARRGMPVNIVFGVTDDPFSAHCWVQAGNMVLNDTVGNAMAHTPIRVI